MAVLQMNNNTSPNNIPVIRTLLNADYTSTHEAMLNTTLSRIENKKQGIITPNENISYTAEIHPLFKPIVVAK